MEPQKRKNDEESSQEKGMDPGLAMIVSIVITLFIVIPQATGLFLATKLYDNNYQSCMALMSQQNPPDLIDGNVYMDQDRNLRQRFPVEYSCVAPAEDQKFLFLGISLVAVNLIAGFLYVLVYLTYAGIRHNLKQSPIREPLIN